MNDAIPTTSEQNGRSAGALQAILQHADGTMGSMAVPLPLPEAIITVEERAVPAHWFWRERSSDSVLRYVERPASEIPTVLHGCAECRERRPVYFVPKTAQESAGLPEQHAYCADCYPRHVSGAAPREDA